MEHQWLLSKTRQDIGTKASMHQGKGIKSSSYRKSMVARKSLVAKEITGHYGKSLIAMEVTSCYGKSVVGWEIHWLLWKVNSCYVMEITVVMGSRQLLLK
jgi:hypothetical protein